MNFNSLIQPLTHCPLDIIGDVHGEIDALRSLMLHLSYDDDGQHSDGRKLVFAGDLTDRGPDSPAVVTFVQRLVTSGQALCVLGNHDLNILLNHRKHENKWFYGEEFFDKGGNLVPQVLADNSIREQVLAFFRTLPIALERDDLRVVHACWNDDMTDIARKSNDVVELYNQHQERIESSFPDMDYDNIDEGLIHQNRNPVKLITSGPEERIDCPIEAGGKIRNERRVRWWNDYKDNFTVFGHYSIPDGEPRGNGSSFCIDYGVGKRWTERKEGKTARFKQKLAALRFPEKVVMFDEGLTSNASLPSWVSGGGVVLHIPCVRRVWQLPMDATPLPSFHVTLMGRKVFSEQHETMESVWELVQATLPSPPMAELDMQVNLAADESRKTWFLHILNQDAFRTYIGELTSILDNAYRRHSGCGLVNLEADRYFHVSVANDQGGDPFKSIGSIKATDRRPLS